jgi:putative nucleotidyltransferase with HDIG domain
MAGYLVGPAAAAEGLQAPLLESVKAALGKEPLVPRDLEVVSEDAVVLDPVAVALSGKVTGAITKAAPLPRMSVEAQTTLLVTAVQVDRLGFGEDAREILGDIASTLRHLFLQRLRTLDYRQGYLSLLNQILRPIEKTLPYMKSHSLAVANYAKQMALKMDLDEMLVENVIVAAILHDIGLLDIDFEILKSRASLSEKDLHEIRKHPVFSREWVEQASFPYPVAPLVYAHHERWDGKGYPEGLRGDAIPLGARIIAVAEAFDAMTSRHSYKPPIAPAAALEEILAGAGTQFDPRVAEVFASVLRRPGKK